MSRKKRNSVIVLLGAVTIAVTSASAAVVYDFNNGNSLDGAGVGGTFVQDGLTLTTTEIISYTGMLGSTNANIKMNSTSANSLGVNSPEGTPAGASSDPRDFDPGEGWSFSFDQDVVLDLLNASSMDTPTEMTISSSAFATKVIAYDDWGNDDINLNTLLSGITISAGTEITLQNTSAVSDGIVSHDWRLTELTVTVIPEPGTLGLMGACAVGAFMIRRFRV